MKNKLIIPALIISSAVIVGVWMLRQVPEAPPQKPRKASVVQVPEILIHDAAKEGRFGAVEQHIAAGTDVDLRDDKGATALHYALNKRVAAPLIANGAQVDAKDYNGYTPLFGAASSNRPEVVDLLIREGADIKHKGFGGEEALVHANGESTIEILFKAGLRYTSIHNAVRGGYLEAVKERITSGVDINEKGKRKESPLNFACYYGHSDVVKLLLLSGANAKETDAQGASLLRTLRVYKPQTFNEILNILIEHGLDVNHKNKEGRTVLQDILRFDMDAYNEEDKKIPYTNTYAFEIVKSLIARGADVNTTDRSFKTPLHAVAENPNSKMAKLLIEAGAKINPKFSSLEEHYNRQTPLHSACSRIVELDKLDSSELIKELRLMIEVFINYGAEINALNGYGNTALYVLSERWDSTGRLLSNVHETEYRKIYRLIVESGGRRLKN